MGTSDLFESELFGHRRGAFTGANENRVGAIESAHRGTLFLDEVGELTADAQVRLLRVLETRRYSRLGDTSPRESDFRLVSATQHDLERLVHERRFREDLYFRIAVVVVDVPPLRQREGDIVLLAPRRVGPRLAACEIWSIARLDGRCLENLQDPNRSHSVALLGESKWHGADGSRPDQPDAGADPSCFVGGPCRHNSRCRDQRDAVLSRSFASRGSRASGAVSPAKWTCRSGVREGSGVWVSTWGNRKSHVGARAIDPD